MHTLSSLHFLSPESRPKSKGDIKNSNNASAFDSTCLDYSKLNTDRHNGARTDTFNTATSPRKKQGPGAKNSGEDLTSLNSAYLISGLRHDIREIGKEIRQEIQEDVADTLMSLRRDVKETLDVISDTRDSTIGVVMSKLTVDIHKVLSDAGWPLKVDFAPIHEDFRDGEQTRVKKYQEMMEQLEDRLGHKIGPLVDEIPVMRSLHEQLKIDSEDAHNRLLEEMRSMKQTLSTDISPTLHSVQEVQQEYVATNSDLEVRLESQLMKHVCEEPVNVDFAEVISTLSDGHRSASSDFARVYSELSALSKDLSKVRDDVTDGVVMKPQEVDVGPKASVDSNWTQTDIRETRSEFSQTEDKFWKAKISGDTKNMKSKMAGYRKTQTDLGLKKEKKDKAIFVDAETMKKKARDALIKKQYNVFDNYYSTGFAQKIAKSTLFENFTFLVVALNALWISIDTDHNKADMLIEAHPVFIVAENMFCTYFTGELLVRLAAFKHKLRCLKDNWFLFDLVLVVLMVGETWVMSIIFLSIGQGSAGMALDPSLLKLIRIVKILRLSRLARLMRAVPEIIIFLKGIGAASRSVAAIMALWGIIVYIFAVFFVQTSNQDLKESIFIDVPSSMNTLLLDGILPDNSRLVRSLSESNPVFWPVIMFFVLIASVTLSYMLIGVLVQIVNVIAGTEKERAVVGTVASYLRGQWTDYGHELDALLTLSDFQTLLVEPNIALFLNDVGVDMLVLVDMAEMIYEDIAKENDGLSFGHFVDAVLNMRGTNPVTVQDVKSQLRIMKRMIKESVTGLEKDISKQFVVSQKSMASLRKAVMGESDSDHSGRHEGDAGEEGDAP